MILRQFPPMGVYETLFRFAEATHAYMGDPGTHPWAQGFPLTTQLPGGPPMPGSVELSATDLKYPAATGSNERGRDQSADSVISRAISAVARLPSGIGSSTQPWNMPSSSR